MSVNINCKRVDPYIEQIAQILTDLPPDKIVAVRDYVLFLQSCYGSSGIVDEIDPALVERISGQAAVNGMKVRVERR